MESLNPYKKSSLVSVIIPCYNHGHYLPVAIESVLQQTHPIVEIIVVDDGSTDNTCQVAQRYTQVKYISQKNKGLSASRNTGIKNCSGDWIIFLDADDWLYPDAIETNLHYLRQNEQAAFVSGSYDNVDEAKNIIAECKVEINANHYQHFLHYNYVGMISTVLYRRWIFDEFLFDETLKACEDYDLYLKIARKYPVIHHTEKIAAYRKHSSNMSLDFEVMLASALSVLQRQKDLLQTSAETEAYKRGQLFWRRYYAMKSYLRVRSAKTKLFKRDLSFLLKARPYLFFKFIVVHPIRGLVGNKIGSTRFANLIKS
jgi:glycosyltransferase involved in cell wall biosynthesis